MRARTVLSFFLLWAALGAAATPPAQAQPGGVPLLRQTLNPDAQRSPLPLPQPTSLVPGWWHYLDGSDEEAVRRAERTAASLQELLPELPVAIRPEAKSFVDLISANLEALPRVRAQRPNEPPAPPAYAEFYTPADYLQLSERLRELRERLAAERADYATAEAELAADLGRNDTEFAAYLKLDTGAPQRGLTGLQIMAERLALLNAAERLRLAKAELDALRLRSDQLGDELAAARQRLRGESVALVESDRTLAWANAALAAAHDKVISARAAASAVTGDGAIDKATAAFLQQRVVNAQVAEVAARVGQIQLRLERSLNALLIDSGSVALRAVRGRMAEWQTALDEISERLPTWRSAAERERRRAGRLVGEEVKPLEPTDISTVNQQRFALAQETLVDLAQLSDRISQARIALDLVEEQLLRREGAFRRLLAHAQQTLARAWESARHGVTTSLFTLGDTPVTLLGLLRILLILFIAWLLSYWTRRVFGRLGRRGDGHNLPAYYTIGRLSHYVIILTGILIGLSSIGMDFTSFALVAGALAIGIGFGLQAIVNNFISGLILLFERSLKVGDFVDLGTGVAGEVQAINVRSTQIKTNENIDIVVPNSEFMNSNVINWTLQEPYLRKHYPFRVAFGEDKDNVRRAGLEAAENVTHTLSGIPGKNPQVWLVDFGENGYIFELVVWLTPSAVKRPQAVRAAYYWELESALQKYSVKVPVPQRDLYLREGFESLQRVDPGREGRDGRDGLDAVDAPVRLSNSG